MSAITPPNAVVRRALNRLLLLCRSRRMAPGDRFPTQDAIRRGFHLTNHIISQAMELLTGTGVVSRRPRSGTVFNGFASYPRDLIQVGIAPAPLHLASPAAALVFTGTVTALFQCGVGIRVFPISHAKAWTPIRIREVPILSDNVGDGDIDALLLPMQHMANDQVVELESLGIPVVHCGCADDDQCGVLIDHHAFAANAVAELHARGCRRPGITYLDRPKPNYSDYWNGFTEALRRLGLGVDDTLLFTSDLVTGRDGGEALAARLLALPADRRPDGLVMPDDRLAQPMQEALLRAGCRIPMVVQTNRQLPLPFGEPVSEHAIDLGELAEAAVRLLMTRLLEPWKPSETLRYVPHAPG